MRPAKNLLLVPCLLRKVLPSEVLDVTQRPVALVNNAAEVLLLCVVCTAAISKTITYCFSIIKLHRLVAKTKLA